MDTRGLAASIKDMRKDIKASALLVMVAKVGGAPIPTVLRARRSAMSVIAGSVIAATTSVMAVGVADPGASRITRVTHAALRSTGAVRRTAGVVLRFRRRRVMVTPKMMSLAQTGVLLRVCTLCVTGAEMEAVKIAAAAVVTTDVAEVAMIDATEDTLRMEEDDRMVDVKTKRRAAGGVRTGVRLARTGDVDSSRMIRAMSTRSRLSLVRLETASTTARRGQAPTSVQLRSALVSATPATASATTSSACSAR